MSGNPRRAKLRLGACRTINRRKVQGFHFNRAVMRKLLMVFMAVAAGAAFSACHPKTREAKQLRASCDAGTLQACNDFGVKLLKGEYVLRDPRTASGLFDRTC